MDYTSYIVNNLANEGIIGFDTATFVTGKAPLPGTNLLPEDIKLKPQADNDGFDKPQSSVSVVKNPLWKKILFGGLLIGGTALGIYKGKQLFKSIKNFFTRHTTPPPPPPAP